MTITVDSSLEVALRDRAAREGFASVEAFAESVLKSAVALPVRQSLRDAIDIAEKDEQAGRVLEGDAARQEFNQWRSAQRHG